MNPTMTPLGVEQLAREVGSAQEITVNPTMTPLGVEQADNVVATVDHDK